MAESLTQHIEKKTPLTPEEKEKLFQQISEAHKIIEDNESELVAKSEEYKDLKKQLESINDEQNAIVVQCLRFYRLGYSTKLVECNVTYVKGEAIFTDKETGEIVEQRPLTEGEQTRLNSNIIIRDAEEIIRKSTESED